MCVTSVLRTTLAEAIKRVRNRCGTSLDEVVATMHPQFEQLGELEGNIVETSHTYAYCRCRSTNEIAAERRIPTVVNKGAACATEANLSVERAGPGNPPPSHAERDVRIGNRTSTNPIPIHGEV